MLLTAERRLALALARPAEVLRFFLLAVEETAGLLRVDRALLCLIDSEDPRLLRVMAGSGAMADDEGELLPIDGSFEGRVFESGSPVRTADLAAEPELYRPRRNQRRGGPAVGVPLRIRSRPIGVLIAAREPGGAPFLERDAELLLEFATPITAAIEAMRQFDSTRRSREAVDAWSREQSLKRWIARYEAVAAGRVEIVFRLDASGLMEWGGSTDSLFGIPPASFAPRLEDLLARVDPFDVDPVRIALKALASPGGPQSTLVDFGLLLRNGSPQRKRLRAWRQRETDEIVGVIGPAPRPSSTEGEAEGQAQGAGPGQQGGSEPSAEAIVRSLRHQINNPLAAVIGRAQLMIREESVQREPFLRQSVETILFESERINRFVQQLQGAEGLSRLAEHPLPGEGRY